MLRFPQTYLNAVDPGRMLYGITSRGEGGHLSLRPTLSKLSTKVIAVRAVTQRDQFAEEAPFPIRPQMRLGVIPFGSADGMDRLTVGHVLVRGRRVPVISRPSLEHTRIDLTDVPDVGVGEEVVIIGKQLGDAIDAETITAKTGIPHNQIATAIGPRVQRTYLSTPIL